MASMIELNEVESRGTLPKAGVEGPFVKDVYICDFSANGTVMGPRRELPLGSELPTKDVSVAFRWYHIAINDTKWIEHYLMKISEINGTYDEHATVKLERTWKRNERPAGSLPKSILPLHCRFMEPSCEAHKPEEGGEYVNTGGQGSERPRDQNRAAVSLFLPYLNWESFERLQALHQHKPSNPIMIGDQDSQVSIHPPTLHQRRTLDQFYYSGLQDTRTRDTGQTVSKWTGTSNISKNGRTEAELTSLVVMVDQLWLWILDGDSVVSFFPTGEHQYRGQNAEFTDFYTSASKHVRDCRDSYDLAALLLKQSTTILFEQENKKFADLLGIYQWAVGNKAARQIEEFEAFSRHQSGIYSTALSSDDTPELNLALEVADILDELNMLAALLEKQREVMNSLHSVLLSLNIKPKAPQQVSGEELSLILDVTQVNSGVTNIDLGPGLRGSVNVGLHQLNSGVMNIASQGDCTGTISDIGGQAGVFIEDARKELRRAIDGVRRLKTDAETTHKMLLNQLDLKQTAASLDEARSTTKQGRAVMLFTIVTILFAPLSFFTSYFGQNVSDITGDGNNPSSADLWKIGGPISVVVIIFALLVAYYISNPESRLWTWRRDKNQSEV